MNTMEFSLLRPYRMRIAVAALLCMLAPLTMAASPAKAKAAKPASETIQPRPELVLTLPDQWPANDNKQLAVSSEQESFSTSDAKLKKRTLNVDCAMDANPLATYDSSLGNRLQGECNLGYRY